MFGTPNYSYGTQFPVGGTQQQAQNSIIWVQGISGAKSYLVAPNQAVLLMDSENSTFYIKSTDSSGMPMPLRVFDYKERVANNATTQQPYDYITREEFEKRLQEISNAKQPVQSTEQ